MAFFSSCGTHTEHTNNGDCSVSFHKTRLQRQKISQQNRWWKCTKKEHKRRPHGNRNYDRSSVLELLWYYVRLEDAGNEAPISLSPLKPSGHYMYRTVVTICTTGFNIHNSTFCPHSVFMCFVWISEQTAIISLYSINWLVLVTEMKSVYSAVRTGYLNVFLV